MTDINYKVPTLYKLDSTGKIREWIGWTEGNTIYISHGVLGGKHQIKTTKCQAKNVGKSNETTPEEQAILELNSKWNKQKDKQYVENVQEQISKGKEFRPMLAEDFQKHGHKIKFPAYVSRKLDGMRCFIKLVDNQPKAFSRNGKEIKVIGHILNSLTHFFPTNSSIVLDGELYSHQIPFEEIIGAIKRDKPNEKTAYITFNVYDCFDEENPDWLFKDRLEFIQSLEYDYIGVVDSYKVNNQEEMLKYKKQFIEEGYEGLMVRNNAEYEQKRTFNLQKLKDFMESEFKIIGVTEDKNQEAVFTCICSNGEFSVKPEGTREYRQSLLKENNIGKLLTVEYFGLTSEGIPRFPVGKAIRDYE